jgi:hypothetical protein
MERRRDFDSFVAYAVQEKKVDDFVRSLLVSSSLPSTPSTSLSEGNKNEGKQEIEFT